MIDAVKELLASNEEKYQHFLAGGGDYEPREISEIFKGDFKALWELPEELLKTVLNHHSLYKTNNILLHRKLVEVIDFTNPPSHDLLMHLPRAALIKIEEHIGELDRIEMSQKEMKNCLIISHSITDILHKRQEVITSAIGRGFREVLERNIDYIISDEVKTETLMVILSMKDADAMKVFTEHLFIKEFEPQAYYRSFTHFARNGNNLEFLHQNMSAEQWSVIEAFYRPYIFYDYVCTQEMKSYISPNAFKNQPFNPHGGDMVATIASGLVGSYNSGRTQEFCANVIIDSDVRQLACFKMILSDSKKLAEFIEDNTDYMTYTTKAHRASKYVATHKERVVASMFNLDVVGAMLLTEEDMEKFVGPISQEKLKSALTIYSRQVNWDNLHSMVQISEITNPRNWISTLTSQFIGPLPPKTQKTVDYIVTEYMLDDYIKAPNSIPHLSIEARKVLDVKKEKRDLESISAGLPNRVGFKL